MFRRQGMRVGAAFSTALDPSRPALFSDVSEMDLLPEEVWHASALPPEKPRSKVRLCAHCCCCSAFFIVQQDSYFADASSTTMPAASP